MRATAVAILLCLCVSLICQTGIHKASYFAETALVPGTTEEAIDRVFQVLKA